MNQDAEFDAAYATWDGDDVDGPQKMLDWLLEEIDGPEGKKVPRHAMFTLAEKEQQRDKFFALVAKRPKILQTQWIANGKQIWKYAIDHAREDVEKLRGEKKGTRWKPSFVDDRAVVDVAFNVETNKTEFLHFDGTAVTRKESHEHSGVTYAPPMSESAGYVQTRSETFAILLPTDAADYGDSKSLAIDVKTFLRNYVTFPDEVSEHLAVTYVFMTYILEQFDAVPYLRAIGDWGGGKSRLVLVVGSICHRPIVISGGTTPAPIFRLIDQWRGTFVMDEGDYDDHSEVGRLLKKIRLQGYKRGFAIARMDGEGGDRDVKTFDPFGPQISSNRKSADPAEDSRCIDIHMPSMPSTKSRAQLPPEFSTQALKLRNQLERWRLDHLRAVELDGDEQIPGVIPRVREVGLSLLATVRAITGEIGSEWEHIILKQLKEVSERAEAARKSSWEGRVAQAIVTRWRTFRKNNGGAEKAYKLDVKDIRRLAIEDVEGKEIPALALKMTQNLVNKILRDTFKLPVIKSNSRYLVEVTKEKFAMIESGYHLGDEDYGQIDEEPKSGAQRFKREPVPRDDKPKREPMKPVKPPLDPTRALRPFKPRSAGNE